MITDEPISAVLDRVKGFKKPKPHRPMLGHQYIGKTYTNLGEILTPEELAQRLKVTVEWVMEKRRPRCPNPIPAIPIGKLIRFDWDNVVKWLEECAAADAKSLQQRRTGHVPQRRKTKGDVVAFPTQTNETAAPARKHRKT
jgi:hypothetical protein